MKNARATRAQRNGRQRYTTRPTFMQESLRPGRLGGYGPLLHCRRTQHGLESESAAGAGCADCRRTGPEDVQEKLVGSLSEAAQSIDGQRPILASH